MNPAQNPTSEIAETIISELDHFQRNFRPQGGELTYHGQQQLTHEPFVGYAHFADKKNAQSKLLICRHYVPSNFRAAAPNIDFASYLSPLGRIVAKKPGQDHQFQVKTRTGFLLEEHHFHLLDKDEFRPHKQDGKWDAIDNQIVWTDGRLLVRSLRKLLEGGPEETQIREFRYSVQLPDQAILDPVQDDIFRLPLRSRVRISGAPGTGKTTVLLKRLSQKTKREFLTDDESKAIKDEDWKDGRNWMLFTPSDLLKMYLKEAMAKELLPASDEHVKVYRTFRLELLRDMGFIRVGQHGYFKAAPIGTQLLKRVTGTEQVALAKGYGGYLAAHYSLVFKEALQEFNNQTRGPLGKLADASQKVLGIALDILSKVSDDGVELRQAQQRATSYRKLNEDLNRLVQNVRGVGALQDEEGDLPLARIYRQTRLLPGIVGLLTTAGIDVALFPDIPPLVEGLRKEVRDLNETLSLGRLFQRIPRSYQEFRETHDAQTRFFQQETEKEIRDRLLSEQEQDVVLFHALEFVQMLHDDIPADLAGVPGEVRGIIARLRLLVAVDEAADFSVLEIACMERFAKPGSGGMTICGDLMQRVTEQGLKEWSDLEALCAPYDPRNLQISYRQTERLFAIAKDLFQHATGSMPTFSSAFPKRAEDPPPLSFKCTEETPAERWLTDRICEIHDLCHKHLPTTAILVPHPDDVDVLKRKLAPLLMENGLEVDAAHGGQALGDSARVRIFPVEFIKGLEFEAVFYVGLDKMAEIHKDLIDKYVYVGLSRARSFLGVTVERQFPQRLKCITDHFVTDGTWLPPL